jgi:hypothetical protein
MQSTPTLVKAVRSAMSVGEKQYSARHVSSTADLCLPDFLGIGAQKAGTTWLYDNLCCHPDLFLPRPKELHYFDRSFHESLRSYADRFAPGEGKVTGEVTPAYGVLPPRRIRFIRRVMPDVRLLFLMRNPVERAWSHAVMNVATKTQRSVDDVPEAEFYAHFTGDSSTRRGDYLRMLDNWLGVFPEEQLFVGFFDDLASRPRELLCALFDHLGVSSAVDWTRFPYAQVIHARGRRIGPGSTVSRVPDPYREFLRQMYADDIAALHERFGSRVAGWS